MQTPSVQFVRELLNGHIRFAHKLTVPLFIWFALFFARRDIELAATKARKAALDGLSPEDRKCAISLLNNAARVVFLGAIRRSLLAILIVPSVLMALVLVGATSAVRARRKMEQFQNAELALAATSDPAVSKLIRKAAAA
jgi:hypothetical protein